MDKHIYIVSAVYEQYIVGFFRYGSADYLKDDGKLYLIGEAHGRLLLRAGVPYRHVYGELRCQRNFYGISAEGVVYVHDNREYGANLAGYAVAVPIDQRP